MRVFLPVNIVLCHTFEQGPDGGPALKAYHDTGGLATIGFGHKLLPSDPLNKQTITAAMAAKLLTDDLIKASVQLRACLGPVETDHLPDGAFGALIDFVFNLGIGAFEHSTLHDLVVHGDLADGPDQLLRWDHGKVNGREEVLEGLLRRRKAEVALWRDGKWSPHA